MTDKDLAHPASQDRAFVPSGSRLRRQARPKASIPLRGEVVHNVTDRRNSFIGSWEIEPEPLDTAKLREEDKGRTVIYRDFGRAEAGTLSSWAATTVFARFNLGDTATACTPSDLHFAIGMVAPETAQGRDL